MMRRQKLKQVRERKKVNRQENKPQNSENDPKLTVSTSQIVEPTSSVTSPQRETIVDQWSSLKTLSHLHASKTRTPKKSSDNKDNVKDVAVTKTFGNEQKESPTPSSPSLNQQLRLSPRRFNRNFGGRGTHLSSPVSIKDRRKNLLAKAGGKSRENYDNKSRHDAGKVPIPTPLEILESVNNEKQHESLTPASPLLSQLSRTPRRFKRNFGRHRVSLSSPVGTPNRENSFHGEEPSLSSHNRETQPFDSPDASRISSGGRDASLQGNQASPYSSSKRRSPWKSSGHSGSQPQREHEGITSPRGHLRSNHLIQSEGANHVDVPPYRSTKFGKPESAKDSPAPRVFDVNEREPPAARKPDRKTYVQKPNEEVDETRQPGEVESLTSPSSINSGDTSDFADKDIPTPPSPSAEPKASGDETQSSPCAPSQPTTQTHQNQLSSPLVKHDFQTKEVRHVIDETLHHSNQPAAIELLNPSSDSDVFKSIDSSPVADSGVMKDSSSVGVQNDHHTRANLILDESKVIQETYSCESTDASQKNPSQSTPKTHQNQPSSPPVELDYQSKEVPNSIDETLHHANQPAVIELLNPSSDSDVFKSIDSSPEADSDVRRDTSSVGLQGDCENTHTKANPIIDEGKVIQETYSCESVDASQKFHEHAALMPPPPPPPSIQHPEPPFSPRVYREDGDRPKLRDSGNSGIQTSNASLGGVCHQTHPVLLAPPPPPPPLGQRCTIPTRSSQEKDRPKNHDELRRLEDKMGQLQVENHGVPTNRQHIGESGNETIPAFSSQSMDPPHEHKERLESDVSRSPPSSDSISAESSVSHNPPPPPQTSPPLMRSNSTQNQSHRHSCVGHERENSCLERQPQSAGCEDHGKAACQVKTHGRNRQHTGESENETSLAFSLQSMDPPTNPRDRLESDVPRSLSSSDSISTESSVSHNPPPPPQTSPPSIRSNFPQTQSHRHSSFGYERENPCRERDHGKADCPINKKERNGTESSIRNDEKMFQRNAVNRFHGVPPPLSSPPTSPHSASSHRHLPTSSRETEQEIGDVMVDSEKIRRKSHHSSCQPQKRAVAPVTIQTNPKNRRGKLAQNSTGTLSEAEEYSSAATRNERGTAMGGNTPWDLRWNKIQDAVNGRGNPSTLSGVSAAKALVRWSRGTRRFRRSVVTVRHHWKRSYDSRTKGHAGYLGVDIFSLYETTFFPVEADALDEFAWEDRDVKQRFLFEKSISFSRNWFGYLRSKRGNDRYREPVCRPQSMLMHDDITVIDWYARWQLQNCSKLDDESSADSSISNDSSSSEFEETLYTSTPRFDDDASERESDSESECSSHYTDDYCTDANSSSEDMASEYDDDDDEEECGTFRNVRQKIGEHVSRVHPNYTSSLRQSRFRKKYFPRGTFPY